MKNIEERFSTQVQRINVFIGSSSESLEVAREIKSHFDEENFNVDIWDEDVFERGKSNLDNLKKFTALYDFAIMVFVQDDEVIHRGKKTGSIPPNVIFEYGLFLGRMGTNKSFILAENNIKSFVDNVFSDIKGISLGKSFDNSSKPKRKKTTKAAVETIRKEMLLNYKSEAEIGFLPSAALAIGYFENFVKRVNKKLYSLRNDEDGILKLDFGKDENFSMSFFRQKFKLIIILPKIILESNHDALLGKVVDFGLVKIRIDAKPRDFPVYWKVQSKEEIKQDGFIFYDFPTTLLASQRTIQLILRKGMSTEDAQIEELVGEKEIYNFIKAINYKIKTSDNTYMRESVEIISDADEYFKNLS
ncbi:MAG: TIR domain-containing protein [Bacteroidota bacterium]